MQYPYEFLYWMECTLLKMRGRARIGADLTAHSIMEERILCLCCEEAEPLMERNGEKDAPKEWVFDLFGDMDRIRFLYSHVNLEEGRFYPFSHWADRYKKHPDRVRRRRRSGRGVFMGGSRAFPFAGGIPRESSRYGGGRPEKNRKSLHSRF